MTDPVLWINAAVSVVESIDAAAAAERFPIKRTGRTAEPAPIPTGVRVVVYMRDEFNCQWCNSDRDLQVDHIVPWSAGGSDDLSNLRTLCGYCNDLRSNFDIDTVQRSAPIWYECLECMFDPREGDERLRRVFCAQCRVIGMAVDDDRDLP